MLLTDTILAYTVIDVRDNSGGKVSEYSDPEIIECRISKNIDPKVATAFGITKEALLHIITLAPLDTMKMYKYNNQKFTVRAQTQNNRFFYATLIEIK